MTKEELVTKLADILDISESTKDFAFKIFTHQIVELLNETQAIIIPNLGAFQLRKEPLLREERFKIKGVEKETKEVLIYSPNTDYTQIKSDSLFLILDLSDNVENNLKFDENIFSIGVNQPTIPLSETHEIDNGKDKALKKSITEKIAELLSNSEIRNDFDLWLEFTGLSHQQDQEGSIAEIKIEPNIEKDDEIDNLMKTGEFIEEELSEEIGKNQGKEDLSTEPEKEISKTDEVQKDIINEEKNPEPEPVESEPSETEPSETESTKAKTEKESTEWDWGDELKAEFKENENEPEISNAEQTGSDEEDNNEIDFPEEEAEIDEDIENSLSSDENADKDEDEQTKQEPTSVHHTVLFSPENTNTEEIKKDIPSLSSAKQKKELNRYGKTFWILFAAFIIVTIIGIYFLFIPSKNTKNLKSTVVDTTNTKNSEVVATLKNPKLKTSEQKSSKNGIQKSKIKTEKKKIKSPKLNHRKYKGQIVYKKIPKETKIGKNIYFDGKEFMVQISSWKSRRIAERQTKKLLKKGYNAFIVKAYLSLLGGQWYRVRVGGFKTKGEALKFLKRK